MRVVFTALAWTSYLHWQATDPKIAARLNALIEECRQNPFTGTGKPEPLRRELKGYWSRRINDEHRLVYRVSGTGDDQRLVITQARFHY